MTKAMLIRRLILVALLVLTVFGVAVVSRLFGGSPGQEIYRIIVDFIQVWVALAAVYLANVFQQRAFFVRALRGLWSDIIEAKNEIIQYTHDPELDQQKFGSAHHIISRAIDEMRGVYRNVGESKTDTGLYPYEPLHDMRKALDALGCDSPNEERRKVARASVLRAWHALRYHFRNEFIPPEPTNPITEPASRDPRAAQKSN